ncbi:MAG TPA: UDP-glucose/GDP-mannose dehydrogenase family protein [Marmoricola sp.]|jgi:UDPglucose 6-dehydrogenase|nr:UDP-glucose/GDP-mannose dehydrogenase family protein [Marmoricola sp.]
MQISVIGTGYLGATHAACLAHWGHDVVGLDREESRVACLAQGRAPFHEPGLDDLLRDGQHAGRLQFTTDPAAIGDCEVHFLCVGTPQCAGGDAADLSAVRAAADTVARVHHRPALVVGKSTVPVGTAQTMGARLREQSDGRLGLAWNPEFLREGQAVSDSLHPERVVLGTDRAQDDTLLRRLYAPLVHAGVPVVSTDLATAELAKASANLMLAARISVVNLLAEVCEAAGGDAADLTRILGLDSRIGRHMLVPGIGYGGGCLPKDSRAFAARAAELGVEGAAALVAEIDRVNHHQVERTVAIAHDLLDGPLQGARIGVLGAAFKGNSDDLRESPAVAVCRLLLDAGARLSVFDPAAAGKLRRELPEVSVAEGAEAACSGADLVLVLTDWSQFADLDPAQLVGSVGGTRPTVLDGRQVLDAQKWRAAGWRVYTLGSGEAA